jgi:hypothetical protein
MIEVMSHNAYVCGFETRVSTMKEKRTKSKTKENRSKYKWNVLGAFLKNCNICIFSRNRVVIATYLQLLLTQSES